MFKEKTKKSGYGYNIITIMTGTAIAQAIPIAISPILTRIYSPSEFGVLAFYVAICSIVVVFSTGRYELAIMLPEDDDDAFQVTLISLLLTLIVSLSLFLIVYFLHEEIAILLNNSDIENWLFLMPFSVMVMGCYQALNYWFNRNKKYKEIARNRVVQSAGTGAFQLMIGVFVNTIGLIAGQLIGQLLSLIFFIKSYLISDHGYYKLKKNRIIFLAKKYSKFPKIDVPTIFLNISASQLPNLFLASLYTPSIAGFFFITQRVLQAPITLISGSVLDVFKQEASEEYKESGCCKNIFKKTFVFLFLFSLLPSIFLYFFVVDVFSFVFGEEWRMAGEFAQVLVPSLFLRFVANPLSFMIYIAEKQIWNFLNTILLVMMVSISLLLPSSPFESVVFISFSYCTYYLINLFMSFRLAMYK